MRRIAILFAIWLGLQFTARAGTIVLTTNTLTRAASITTILANTLEAKAHAAKVKAVLVKIRHPKRKATK